MRVDPSCHGDARAVTGATLHNLGGRPQHTSRNRRGRRGTAARGLMWNWRASGEGIGIRQCGPRSWSEAPSRRVREFHIRPLHCPGAPHSDDACPLPLREPGRTLALSPILVEVARDFDVSTATAGQLRAIFGSVAAVTAFGVGALAARVGLRSLLLGGLGTLALASVPGGGAHLAALAGAQVLLGAAVGILLSAGIAGTTAWIPRERARTPSRRHSPGRRSHGSSACRSSARWAT